MANSNLDTTSQFIALYEVNGESYTSEWVTGIVAIQNVMNDLYGKNISEVRVGRMVEGDNQMKVNTYVKKDTWAKKS